MSMYAAIRGWYERFGLRQGRLIPKIKPQDVIKNWNIVTGDIVEVINGKDKGTIGKVLATLRMRNQVLVENANLRLRVNRDETDPSKRFVYMPSGIHYSNVALIDPKTQRPTRIKIQKKEIAVTPDGKKEKRKVRVAVKSGEIIPKPVVQEKVKKMGENDTAPQLVLERTYFPDIEERAVPPGCKL